MYRLIALCVLVAGCYASPIERIVNGTNAQWGEIPYIVSLRYDNSHTCGASILDENHILTAAHCVYGRDSQATRFSIQYGILKITSDSHNVVQVKEIIIHPDYISGYNYANDVAVLVLNGKIQYSETTTPTQLPEQDEATPGNDWSILAGWGLPYTGGSVMRDLQRVDILCYTDSECTRIHGSTNSVNHVCAGVPEGGKGQCSGDSGGPLYANGVQIGVVSWSVKPCTIKGYPGVFAKVSSYVDWIHEQMLIQ